MHAIRTSLFSFWQHGRPVERTAYVVGALLLLSGAVHLAILVVSGGTWLGPLSLRKPMSFGLSFGLTVVTIAWVTSFMRFSSRTRAVLLGTFTATSVIETLLVSLQAWRGVPSHFNVETPFDALVTRGLAAGGITLVVLVLMLTIAALRSNPTIPPSLRIAIRAGFVTLCAAMAVGGLMIANGMTLVFAGDPQAAYAAGGSLKPIHAVTMHAILVLPALAWLLSLTTWSEQRRVRVVLLAVAGYATLVAVVTAQTFVGFELNHAPVAAIAFGVGPSHARLGHPFARRFSAFPASRRSQGSLPQPDSSRLRGAFNSERH